MTVLFIVATGAGTFSAPGNWPGSGQVECVGDGGAGNSGSNTPAEGSGGAGGQYSKKNTVTAANGANLFIGAGGSSAGASGTGTGFNGTTVGNATCSAGGGGGGQTSGQPGAGGTGGNGDTTHAGGSGGAWTQTASDGAIGGGGAGGPNGVGAAGGAPGATTGTGGTGGGGGGGGTAGAAGAANNGSAGGLGANGSGTVGGTGGSGGASSGAAGTAGSSSSSSSGGGGGGGFNGPNSAGTAGAGGNGGAGTEWDSSHGSGGGGGGNGQATSGTTPAPGNGGLYGGGGAGGGNGSFTGFGSGAQGLIVITYTPAAGVPLLGQTTPTTSGTGNNQAGGTLFWYSFFNAYAATGGIATAINAYVSATGGGATTLYVGLYNSSGTLLASGSIAIATGLLSITISNTTIVYGQQYTVSWQVDNGTVSIADNGVSGSCFGSARGAGLPPSTLPTSGVIATNPGVPSIYILGTANAGASGAPLGGAGRTQWHWR